MEDITVAESNALRYGLITAELERSTRPNGRYFHDRTESPPTWYHRD